MGSEAIEFDQAPRCAPARRRWPRPTLHYRLPNSEIDKPGWGLGALWGDWLVLERLACDPAAPGCRGLVAFLDRPLSRLTGDWPRECAQWLRIIQAVEMPDRPFVVGVQWHPEFLLYQRRQRRLFRALVDCARRRRTRRGGG